MTQTVSNLLSTDTSLFCYFLLCSLFTFGIFKENIIRKVSQEEKEEQEEQEQENIPSFFAFLVEILFLRTWILSSLLEEFVENSECSISNWIALFLFRRNWNVNG